MIFDKKLFDKVLVFALNLNKLYNKFNLKVYDFLTVKDYYIHRESEKLLSDKLKKSYESSQLIELKTKSTSFKNLSRISKSKKADNELLKKISEYIKKQPEKKEDNFQDNSEIVIVDNPKEINFVFPNLSDLASDVTLPFFKSINYKLTKIYG